MGFRRLERICSGTLAWRAGACRTSVTVQLAVIGFVILASVSVPASAQAQGAPGGQQGQGQGPGGNQQGGGLNGPGGAPRNGNIPPSQIPEPDTTQRPIFLSGKVVLSDGVPPPEPVAIERLCSGSRRTEGYTDRKGRFSFELGRNAEFQDASTGGFDGFPEGPGQLGNRTGFPQGGNRNSGRNSMGGGMDTRLIGCELRAVLPGYTSDAVELSTRHPLDNPDLGTIVLHRLGKAEGFTLSATSAMAPNDARKEYEKGLAVALKKPKDDKETEKWLQEIQKHFAKAVEVYPKYAAAWVELGKVYENQKNLTDARQAYEKAVAADGKFVPPYERMAVLSMRDGNWQDLANMTDRVLTLDPYTFPDAFYMSGVANLQLHNLDRAEKNTREAIKVDTQKRNPRAQYLLGVILAQKQQFTESAEAIRTYLAADPNAQDADKIREQLQQVEQAAGQTQAAPNTANQATPNN